MIIPIGFNVITQTFDKFTVSDFIYCSVGSAKLDKKVTAKRKTGYKSVPVTQRARAFGQFTLEALYEHY